MNMLKGAANMQSLTQMLNKALEKEGECWQSGLFQSTTPALSDAITGVKRDLVVVWMIDKAEKFGFQPETWALSVTILDRFLQTVKAQSKYLQCIALTCLIIAAKFSEEENTLPSTAELVANSKCGYTVSDVVRMERIIVSKLQWHMRVANPLEFVHIFHALLLTNNGFTSPRDVCTQLAALTASLRRCAAWHTLLCFRPATIALAVLSLELEFTGDGWLPITMCFQRLAMIDNESLIQCREKIAYFLSSPGDSSSLLSRPVKRKMCKSECSEPGDEEMYDGIKRLYGSDEDYLVPGGCGGGGKIGCGVEMMQSSMAASREMATVAI